MSNNVKRILLVEDSEHDLEMTLAALEEQKLGNQVDVARDGAEAMDYLYRRGAFAGRSDGLPVVVLLDLKMPRMDGLAVLAADEVRSGIKRSGGDAHFLAGGAGFGAQLRTGGQCLCGQAGGLRAVYGGHSPDWLLLGGDQRTATFFAS